MNPKLRSTNIHWLFLHKALAVYRKRLWGWICFWGGMAFLLWVTPLHAQPLDSLFAHPALTLNGLPQCNQMEVDSEGNIYLLDTQNSRLFKYIAQASYDSLITLGGKSVREEGLIQPIKFSGRNRQNLYVLDEASRRILLLSPNFRVNEAIDFTKLNYAFELQQNSEDIYPVSFDVNPAGEIFVLNQWDNKIYKLLPGEITLAFGGTDFGEGALWNPLDIQISSDNLIWVQDGQQLKVYDAFGHYKYTLDPKVPFDWHRFQLQAPYLLCFNEQQLFVRHLTTHQTLLHSFNKEVSLQDVQLTRTSIYLLFRNSLVLYEN